MRSSLLTVLAIAGIAVAAVAPAHADDAGDAEHGRKVFNRCKICHTIEAGQPNRTGPNLHGVVGRKIGSVKGFRYSKAMKKADFVWDEERLDAYLANPRKYLPKNRMSFPGLKKAKDRADVIAYLKSMSK